MNSDDFTPIIVNWKSSAEGTYNILLQDLKGMIVRVDFIPGTGDAAPTDQYDFVLLDSAGVDVFQGAGANLANNAIKVIAPCILTTGGSEMPITITGDHTLSGSGLGANKDGKIVVRLRY